MRDRDARVEALIGKGTQLLLRTCRHGEVSEFPYWVAPDGGKAQMGRRLAWCYGDLSIAVALTTVGRRCGDPALSRVGIELAVRTVERRGAAEDVTDPMLCHGAIGNAHAYNRLHHATDDERFRDAALHWMEQALALRVPGEGIAGFGCAASAIDHESHRSMSVPGLLTGVGGLVLGLLAFVSDVTPAWDAALLLDVPRTGEASG